MNPDQLINFFNNSGLIPGQKSAEIAAFFKPVFIARHSYFLKENSLSNQYLFLENGFMRAFAYDPEGNEVTTNFYAGNQVVFEVNSFFNRTPSKENIQAITDCYGWEISFEQLNHLFHTLPEFRESGRHILVKGFTALKARMLSMITETAEERYVHLLQSKPEIFQHIPLKHIATYLGITDSSLSRIRKEYSRKNKL